MSAETVERKGAESAAVMHPQGAALYPEGRTERLAGWICAGTGLTLFAVMGLLGLVMRLTQGDAIGVSPEWFYRLLTLHGAGMLTGALLAMMGGAWFAVRPSAPVSFERLIASYVLIVVGAVAVVVATLLGGFAAGWTFLYPLPFDAAGEWSTWAALTFFGGLTLVGFGFFVFCIDMLQATTSAYGGYARALGIPFLRGRDDDPPPPSVIGATVVATEGMMASAVGTTIVVALIGRAIDGDVAIDALWAKNLTYFFGHSLANLIIYLAATLIYVMLPRYAGRPWKTTKPIVVAWMATLVFVATAYSHHLYMDFVQPGWAQLISTISSSAAAIPVAVVTIYTGMMLVWGSRYRWTLASVLLYLGFAGWAIGGMGAVIDSLIPINFRFHNTLWVPAHFHTYLMLGVIFWVMAFVAHLLERAADRVASPRATMLATTGMIAGGYGLVASWYVSGALGVPRRYAIEPLGTAGYSLAGAIAVIVFALGFLVLLGQFYSLGRDALRRQRAAQPAEAPAPQPRIAGASREADLVPEPTLATPKQIGAAVAIWVACGFVFLPPVQEASEASTQYHHLAHAVMVLGAACFGAAVISTLAIWTPLRRRWATAGLVAVVVAPAAMLLAMVPGVYGGLEDNDTLHAAYHTGLVILAVVTGMGAALMGRSTGKLLIALSAGMMLMYAAGVTGG